MEDQPMQLWVDKLVSEYGKDKYALEKYRKTLDRGDNSQNEESEILGGMIADMQFALDWIRTGRRPGSRRCAEQF
jgi:RNA polymerase sigma-70 factor (ECF subfamily)